ncbi:MAG: gliding motility-associated C-terminal domain-containing protein [Bacteroidota bacterium]
MNFSINWDPNVLDFVSVENATLRGLEVDRDFFTDNTGTGFLVLTWDQIEAVLLPDDTRIFSLCFRAIGPVGTSTPVSFVDDPQRIFVSTTTNGNAGLNTSDGTVTILPPESLNLNVSNATVSPGQPFCIDVTAENFNELVELKYSMGWETKLLEFDRVDNFGIPGLDASDFDVSSAASGFLSVDWTSEDFAGESLPDDAILYSICFNAKDDAKLGDCDAVFFSDIPDPIRAVTANSGGNSIAVTDLGNDVCIFDPGGLTVEASDVMDVEPESTVCIPINVRRFEDFSEMKFSLNWNPSLFEFVNVQPTGTLPGLTVNNFSTNLSSLGIIGVSWQSADGSGVDVNDEEVIFEICLKAVGQRLSCSNMEITSSPVPFEVKSPATGDSNQSLNPLNGQLCIGDALALELVSTTPPTCSTSDDGSIRIVVNGGNENSYTYFWTDESGTVQGTDATVNGLASGNYIFNVTDANGLTLTDTVMLDSRNPAPIANAGPDRNLSCGQTSALLQILGSSVGENISYTWEIIEGRGNTIAQNFLANEAGIYQLMVTNDSTGCSAVDTVVVTLSDQPNVDAGEDRSLSCIEESIQLDGSNSDQEDDITYQWSTRNGGVILEGENTLNPTIEVAGTYILILTKEGTESVCTASDTVIVTDSRINIVADAGADRILGCSGEPVVLGSSRSTMGDNITVQWTDEGGGLVSGTENQLEAEAVSPGAYILTITDQVSGCFAVDTVMVNPDENLPVVAPGFIDQLDCNTTEVALNIQVSNTSGSDVSVIWFDTNGRLESPNDTAFAPMVSEPGIYEVIVTNVESGCSTTQGGIEVTFNFDEPTANVEGETVLGCEATSSIILSAAGSSEGDGFIYNWTSNMENALIRANEDEAEVFDPATYYLEVTNISNGCTAVDSITLTVTEDRPTVNIAMPIPIPCTGGTTELDGSGSSEGTYSWVRLEEGGIILNADENIATVEEPGLYGLRVTDMDGCVAFDSILVTQADTSSIQVEVDYSSRDLTCTIDAATVTISASPADGNYIYNWIADNGQNVPDPAAAMNEISEAGLITVEVTETNLNCTRTALVILNRDEELSEIAVVDDTDALTLDCGSGIVMLDASATNPTSQEEFIWKDPNGNIIDGAGLTPEVGEPGMYTFILSNPENGCTDSLSINVETASDLVAVIEEVEDITCVDTLILLRGFNSSNGQNIEYEWTSAEGNEVRPLEGAAAFITMPGTYTLLVRNTETMCEATTSVTVSSNLETPTADAGLDEDLGCGTSLAIGDINPTIGDSITYSWTLNGQAIPENMARINASSPGTYVLTVLNTTNGCSASDEVVITQNFQLELADAGSGETTCERDSLLLMANLPDGAQGVWTTTSPDARIGDATSPETLIGRLERGENLFIWTLSTAECPSYSADTVIISVEQAPVANNDRFELGAKDDSISLRVVANDNLFNVLDWSAEVQNKPSLGEVTSFVNGLARYTTRAFASGTDQFTYEICSITCPDLCSSATVTIEIERDKDSQFDDLPNVITVNNDELNNELIFDVLTTGNFPDNQISIFNRWGDIVYEAKPYMNDWAGIGLDGKELPQGTYYYILRLDVAEGIIIRGDITILK